MKTEVLFMKKESGLKLFGRMLYLFFTVSYCSEGWFLYSLIEAKSRYLIDGPISRGDNLIISLEYYHPILHDCFVIEYDTNF